jgi:phosphohistidine swiveling domain-containing protein
MNGEEVTDERSAKDAPRSAVDHLLRALAEQFEVAMGKPERVQDSCEQLQRLLSSPPSEADIHYLLQLTPLLAKPSRALVLPLFGFMEQATEDCAKPWPLLKGLLSVRDRDLARRALTLADRRARDGSMVVDRELLLFFAQQVETPGSPLAEPELLLLIRDMIRARDVSQQPTLGDPVVSLFAEETDASIRNLAARLLDSSGEPVTLGLAKELLGAEATLVLAPYLIYTRATHRDILSLIPPPHSSPPALPSISTAHRALGEKLLREIIAELGWQRLALGIEIQPYVRVAAGENFPLMLHPSEAQLARRCGRVHAVDELFVVTAHGGMTTATAEPAGASEPAKVFREYNLVHAQLLADFLAVAPLTRERVQGILDRMERVVRDFITLFSSLHDECTILPGLYGDLKGKIAGELQRNESDLSLELTRLVMMFEDPPSLGKVQTLHGLKRYLHQKALQLGFKLVQRNISTNRTMDVVIASRKRILRHVGGIRYSDFEPEEETGQSPRRIPYPVKIVADGFARQAIVGHESFPRVDIFCYGNEVHYFLAYKNHPAFLRINYAPPFQGGMIDLEYYGVSKYELAEHPDLSLPALRRFFKSLEFDAQVESTRVHARYDKEQAPDLRSLCEKAEAMFRLAPYLLDIDWTIGSLRLDAEAQVKVAEAWASFFEAWGVLPLRQLLTADRQGIMQSIAITPTGRQEKVWSGAGPYQDRFSDWPADFLPKLVAAAEELHAGVMPPGPGPTRSLTAQIRLERSILASLRHSVARGELKEKPDGYAISPAQAFERRAAAEHFAQIIASGDADVEASATLASLVAPLERILPFRTIGSVEGFTVQSAQLPLKDDDLTVYVLREEHGTVCLAFYAYGDTLYRSRATGSQEWKTNARADAMEFGSVLRRANYPAPGLEARATAGSDRVREIRDLLAHAPRHRPRMPIPGEQTLVGLRASPGRFSGRALFGTKSRLPEEFDGAVLVSPALQPEDSPYLYRAAGIVSTGGGILSHAGLLAAQFRKPAIIVSGHWESGPSKRPQLHSVSSDYEEEEKTASGYRTTIRTYQRDRDVILREGDLLALESGEDVVRVLGQEVETLEFHEGILQLADAEASLGRAALDSDILLARGRRIRARHQLEKVFRKMSDAGLTCHALSELLLGRAVAPVDRLHLLRIILANPHVAETARGHLRWVSQRLFESALTSLAKAKRQIPDSGSLYEVLHLRLEALRAHQTNAEASAPLEETGLEARREDPNALGELDQLACGRLAQLRVENAQSLCRIDPHSGNARMRHLLRERRRLENVIGGAEEQPDRFAPLAAELDRRDSAVRSALLQKIVVWPEDGGIELFPLIGWKAANLAEIRCLAPDLNVPPWFAVTDRAFKQMLESPIVEALPGGTKVLFEGPTVIAAIEAVLRNPRLNHAQQSSQIRGLWDSIILPDNVVREVLAAYRRIAPPASLSDGGSALVALRSSSHQEDTEFATRAGEFDTFLFIRGEGALLQYLKRTWSGLWSERSLHHRSILRSPLSRAGGGVIVQSMVDSRVSGVVQTINIAMNDFREIVINAGLGLGMGIVSGTVAADHVVVAKGGDPEKGSIRFRYETAEKREYVVYDRRAGFGTLQCEAPYHQRRRPALEYAELCELVGAATRLERLYGYPLDIEFGIEGGRLWMLQARPVPQSLSTLQETTGHYPLSEPLPSSHDIRGSERHD